MKTVVINGFIYYNNSPIDKLNEVSELMNLPFWSVFDQNTYPLSMAICEDKNAASDDILSHGIEIK